MLSVVTTTTIFPEKITFSSISFFQSIKTEPKLSLHTLFSAPLLKANWKHQVKVVLLLFGVYNLHSYFIIPEFSKKNWILNAKQNFQNSCCSRKKHCPHSWMTAAEVAA